MRTRPPPGSRRTRRPARRSSESGTAGTDRVSQKSAAPVTRREPGGLVEGVARLAPEVAKFNGAKHNTRALSRPGHRAEDRTMSRTAEIEICNQLARVTPAAVEPALSPALTFTATRFAAGGPLG